MDKVSYALGMSIGQNLKSSGFNAVNAEDFLSGLNIVLNGEKTEMSFEEAQTVLNQYFAELQAKAAGQNKENGEKYLSENAKKDGVTVLASGLQYEVITMGEGAKPKLDDTVSCHYHGTLVDGTVFDSSVQRGQPAEFPLKGVIKGWTEVLQLMPVGSKWRVSLPSDLAYGDRGAGQHIQPGSTLIFEIELLDIV